MTEILVGVVLGQAMALVINGLCSRHYGACKVNRCRRCKGSEWYLGLVR